MAAQAPRRAARRRFVFRPALHLGATAAVIASMALAIGPDVWIQGISVGVTFLTVPAARWLFFGLGLGLILALAWPYLPFGSTAPGDRNGPSSHHRPR